MGIQASPFLHGGGFAPSSSCSAQQSFAQGSPFASAQQASPFGAQQSLGAQQASPFGMQQASPFGTQQASPFGGQSFNLASPQQQSAMPQAQSGDAMGMMMGMMTMMMGMLTMVMGLLFNMLGGGMPGGQSPPGTGSNPPAGNNPGTIGGVPGGPEQPESGNNPKKKKKNGGDGTIGGNPGGDNPGSGNPGSSTSSMQRLADTAKSAGGAMNAPGRCLAGVAKTLRAFGKGQMTPGKPSAYMAAADMRSKPDQFEEVKGVSAADLKKLGPGYIVVYDRGGGGLMGEHGHIYVTLGGGKESSSRVRDIFSPPAGFSVFKLKE